MNLRMGEVTRSIKESTNVSIQLSVLSMLLSVIAYVCFLQIDRTQYNQQLLVALTSACCCIAVTLSKIKAAETKYTNEVSCCLLVA